MQRLRVPEDEHVPDGWTWTIALRPLTQLEPEFGASESLGMNAISRWISEGQEQY